MKPIQFLIVNLALIACSVIVAKTAVVIIPPMQELLAEQPIALLAVGMCVAGTGIAYLWALHRFVNLVARWRNGRKA